MCILLLILQQNFTMRYIFKVQVLTPDNTKSGFFRELFRQSMEVDSALSFDYQKVVDAFFYSLPE